MNPYSCCSNNCCDYHNRFVSHSKTDEIVALVDKVYQLVERLNNQDKKINNFKQEHSENKESFALDKLIKLVGILKSKELGISKNQVVNRDKQNTFLNRQIEIVELQRRFVKLQRQIEIVELQSKNIQTQFQIEIVKLQSQLINLVSQIETLVLELQEKEDDFRKSLNNQNPSDNDIIAQVGQKTLDANVEPMLKQMDQIPINNQTILSEKLVIIEFILNKEKDVFYWTTLKDVIYDKNENITELNLRQEKLENYQKHFDDILQTQKYGPFFALCSVNENDNKPFPTNSFFNTTAKVTAQFMGFLKYNQGKNFEFFTKLKSQLRPVMATFAKQKCNLPSAPYVNWPPHTVTITKTNEETNTIDSKELKLIQNLLHLHPKALRDALFFGLAHQVPEALTSFLAPYPPSPTGIGGWGHKKANLDEDDSLVFISTEEFNKKTDALETLTVKPTHSSVREFLEEHKESVVYM